MTAARSVAPVALFAYNRPRHVRRTVVSLVANDLASETDLFVFLDGPKSDADKLAVEEVRDYISSICEFRSVSISEQETNIGLANSIIGGVSQVLEQHESIIVLEDDIVTSPFFLRYMNDALETYRHEASVAGIHAFVYEIEGLPETFFLRGADCWGWATWRRAWRVFDSDGARLLQELKRRSLRDEFDLDGTMPYTQMLQDQIEGGNNSWAIRWHASAFLEGMLTLHPGRSLVQNIGLDGSGTHCQNVPAHLDVTATSWPVRVNGLPLVEDRSAREKIIKFLRSQNAPRVRDESLTSRVLGFLRSALPFR